MAKAVPLPEVGRAIEAMKERHPATPDQLIPLLQFMQGELGYLPVDGMNAIAEYLKAPPSHIYGVATFYTQFRFKPLGKNKITVCRGTACHVRGGSAVIQEIKKQLDLDPGGTTADLQFSLETVACVGSCALAPVIVVNNRVYGKVTAKRMKEILDEMRGIAPAPESEETEPKPAPKPVPQEPAKEAPKPPAPEKKAAPAPPAATEKAAPPPPKKTAGKARAKKPAKKAPAPAAKKAAKKASKKAAKKAPAKAVKKVVKKAVKKAAKKTPSKAGPKSAAKSSKKVVKKTVKKSGAKKAKAGKRK